MKRRPQWLPLSLPSPPLPLLSLFSFVKVVSLLSLPFSASNISSSTLLSNFSPWRFCMDFALCLVIGLICSKICSRCCHWPSQCRGNNLKYESMKLDGNTSLHRTEAAGTLSSCRPPGVLFSFKPLCSLFGHSLLIFFTQFIGVYILKSIPEYTPSPVDGHPSFPSPSFSLFHSFNFSNLFHPFGLYLSGLFLL